MQKGFRLLGFRAHFLRLPEGSRQPLSLGAQRGSYVSPLGRSLVGRMPIIGWLSGYSFFSRILAAVEVCCSSEEP